ncbi:hypothetical protein C8D87_111107 [Lentzea atacamensis]|uniref:Ribbon-helix-helix protein CopG domain-containing protein n=1 Tax=Lentzea atacamensis TaxID=531938 RepID=A0ABX9E0V8_9PSEU|nr:hypothetical protein [Lentzea atacamensis]RAS60688.1 hypothetical protein C8D87_111107 [Lentzea atacamensis]
MERLELDQDVHQQVRLLARAWSVTESEVIRRLVNAFVNQDAVAAPAAPVEPVAIYADYEGHHVEAEFHPATRRVSITSGSLTGRSFKSPSGAAIAVVQALNPSVHPNRNGWSFWFIQETGRALQSIRSSSNS